MNQDTSRFILVMNVHNRDPRPWIRDLININALETMMAIEQ